MPHLNGTTQANGHHEPLPTNDLEDDGNNQANGTDDIPPAEAHKDADYIRRITVPLNDVPAWTPTRKLRIVIIGAGYSGMVRYS